jgi:SAM-dependent methyltransferase
MWTIGDYPTIARHLHPIAVATVDAAGVRAGDRVLDVAVGDGNAAILCAQRGASVLGVDLTPAQIERARARCAAEGAAVDLRVGDAEALDVDDGAFDVVLSVMGVIFAPHPERAASELARACRPGGSVAMTAWAEGGWGTSWREEARASGLLPVPPPGVHIPEEWGDPAVAEARLRSAGLEPAVSRHEFRWRFPSEQDALDTFFTAAGPFVSLLEGATAAGRGEEARRTVAEAVSAQNQATDGTCVLPAPWLLLVARRGR